jgi:hypothetical protein
MEGINNKIQLAKRRARGYRNIDNYINMIYFIADKMKFNYDTIRYRAGINVHNNNDAFQLKWYIAYFLDHASSYKYIY